MISVDKPGSPSEILEHFGRKGMKWGVRQRSQAAGYKAGKAAAKEARASGAGVRGRRKAGRQAYKTTSKETSRSLRTQNKATKAATKAARPARKGVAPGRASREFRAKNPTAKTQARAIRGARKESRAREKAIRNMRKKDSVEAARMLRDHMNHPGTAIALRTTRGEKAAVGIIAGALVAGSKPGGPTRAGVRGATVLSVANTMDRRSIEKKQRKGGFK